MILTKPASCRFHRAMLARYADGPRSHNRQHAREGLGGRHA